MLGSAFGRKEFETGLLNEKVEVLLWGVCPNDKVALLPGLLKEKRAGLGSVCCFPFSCMSLVGLSSIRRSWSSFLGGVTGREVALPATPNVNGLLETSLPLLLLVGAPNVIPDVGPGATAGRPKVNKGFLSTTAGGVLGAAPNEKGLFTPPSPAALGGWPNEKLVPGADATLDGVVEGAGGTGWLKAVDNVGGFTTPAAWPPNGDVGLELPKGVGGISMSGTALTMGSGSVTLAGPKVNRG
jgi:hypothetical protein